MVALKARGEALGLDTGLNPRLIYPVSHLVNHVAGNLLGPMKPLVGDKAFAYTSGLYQDGRGCAAACGRWATKAYLFALNRLLAARQAGQRRPVLTAEVRQTLEEMHARYGTAHTGDFEGWSALRGEDL